MDISIVCVRSISPESRYLHSQRLRHRFHLVSPSPWPFLISFFLLNLVVGLTLFFHKYSYSLQFFFTTLFITLFIMAAWFRDIVIEGTYEGQHTLKVQRGLRLGIMLFIVSEIMFFFAFFWAFFHSSLSPAVQIGCVWPPLGIETMNYLGLPLLNTALLLSSGITLTWFHYLLLKKGEHYFSIPLRKKSRSRWWLWVSIPRYWSFLLPQFFSMKYIYSFSERIVAIGITIFLGILFLNYQGQEYIMGNFTISDSVYGSVFYMLTGFHGFHVMVGMLWLCICLVRDVLGHFSPKHHVSVEGAIWYWHFVDVVWIFLYLVLYCWGF